MFQRLTCCGLMFLGLAVWLPETEACNPNTAVLLEYRIEPVELAERADVPKLELHEDGCIEVRDAGWHRDPGRYRFQLSPSELAQLMRDLDGDLFAFDPAQAQLALQAADAERAALARAANAPQTLNVVSDGDVSRFRMMVTTTQAKRFGVGSGRSIAREVTWHELGHAAEHHPEVTDLVALARAEACLRALMNDSRRVRVAR